MLPTTNNPATRAAALIFTVASAAGAFAQTAAPAPGAAPAGAPADSGLAGMLPLFAILGVFFWLIILRPQQAEQKKTDSLRDGVKKGDRVRTIGGAYGTVVAVDAGARTVKIEFDKNTRIEFDKAAIAAVIAKDGSKDGAKDTPVA